MKEAFSVWIIQGKYNFHSFYCDQPTVNIVYVIESAAYGVLFTSCLCHCIVK